MAASSYYSTVQKAYIAFYGRPADPSGLTYWATRIDAAGGNISSIITAFGNSAEATSLYGGVSNAVAVNNLYQQIFGRDADITGLNYYVGKLLDGSFTLVDIAQRIIDGASGGDATIVANKLTAAQSFTDAIDTAAELIGYSGDAAAVAARSWLDTVDATTASVTTAQSTVTATLASLASGAGGASTTTALSTSVDNLEGTNANDTYTAVSNTGSATWNNGDVIDGAGGTDTVSILATGTDTTIVGLSNIETVSVRLLSDSQLEAVDWNGVDTVTVASNSLTEADLTLTNADVGSTYVVNGGHDLTISSFVNASASTFATVVNNAGSATSDATVFALAGATGSVANITVAASGTNFVRFDATAGASAITISGAGTLYATGVESTVTTVNASAYAGSLTLNLNTGAAVTVTGGASADRINFGAAGGLTTDDVVDGGAGTDTLVATLSTSRLNLSNVDNVENFDATFAGVTGLVDASGASLSTLNVRADVASEIAVRNLTVSTVNLLDDDINGFSADLAAGASLTVNGGSASGGAVDVGSLTVTDATSVTLNAYGTAQPVIDFGAVNVGDATTLTAAVSSADMTVASLTGSGLTAISITTNGTADFRNEGAFADASALSTITITANNAGDVHLVDGANVGADAGLNDVSINITTTNRAGVYADGFTLSTSGSLTALNIQAGSGSTVGTAGQMVITGGGESTVGDITVSAGQDATVNLGAISLSLTTGSLGAIVINAGASADVNLSGFVTAQTIDSLTVTVADGGTFTGTAILGSVIGDIELTGANQVINDIRAVTSLGDITFTGSSLQIGQIGNSVLGTAVTEIGDITINAATTNGQSVIESITAATVGNITLSGSADFTIGKINATSVGTIDLTGMNGSSNTTVTIDLSGVVNAVEINTGSANTVITSGLGNDTFNLASAEGVDTIVFTSTAQANDIVTNFQVGTGGDVISLSSTAMALFQVGAVGAALLGTADNFVEIASGAYTATNVTAADYIVISATAFADANSMIAALATAGQARIYDTVDDSATGGLTVVWTDGTDSYVTRLVLATGETGNLVQMGATATDVTLATLYGVDRADLEGWLVTNLDLAN